MGACHNCGSDLTGQYCTICGARAATSPSQTRRRVRLSPRRGTSVMTAILLSFALFGVGVIAGFWLGQEVSSGRGESSGQGALTSTVDPDLPALVLAEQYLDQGVEQMQNKDRTEAANAFRKAAAQFERAIAEEPDNLYARSYLGLTHFYIGNFEQGIAVEREVLKQDPNYLWAIFNLAWMYESTGKAVEAGLLYQKYVETAPAERAQSAKYAEQYELIDRQLEAARSAAVNLTEGGGL